MDGANNRRRPLAGSPAQSTADSTTRRKRCKFCRGFFTPNPNQARHDFCRDECRKNFHKYGALPLAKLKADLTREFSRMIAAELAPLRDRVKALERDFSLAESGLPPMDGAVSSLLARVDVLDQWARTYPFRAQDANAKRGGGAGA